MDARRLGDWLAAALPTWTDQVILEVVELPGGWESDVYRFDLVHGPDRTTERLVLRRYVGDGGVAVCEYEGMRRLFSAGYPVPEVIAVEPDAEPLGRPFLVMRWAPGAADRSWPDVADPAEFPRFVGLLRRLHELDWRPFVDADDHEKLAAGRSVPDTLHLWRSIALQHPVASFEPLMAWLEDNARRLPSVEPAVVHWDFHVGNILVADDGTQTVIDWTQIEVTDPRFDVAWTGLLMGMALGDEDAGARLCTEYERHGRALEAMEFFDVAVALKRLYTVAASLAAGPETLGMRPEAAERMRGDIHTLQVPYFTVRRITGIRITEIETLLESG
jgi:aminoglycoside phosphotransferase (APT) family kinase protein